MSLDNVRIEKDAAGEPTGRLSRSRHQLLHRQPVHEPAAATLPLLQPAAMAPGTERAMRAANAMGVTTIYKRHLIMFKLIEMYRSCVRRTG